METSPHYSLKDLVIYYLKLGTWGFGGPVALVGYMHRDLVDQVADQGDLLVQHAETLHLAHLRDRLERALQHVGVLLELLVAVLVPGHRREPRRLPEVAL